MRHTGARVAGTLVGLLFAATGVATAHVDYVTEGGDSMTFAELLSAILGSPTSLVLLAGGALAGLALVVGYLRFASAVSDIEVARRTLRSYRPYLPWMLRLSVGLPLVGAGFAGYLFSPSIPASGRLLQVSIGFLLLFGLATRPIAAVGLLAYLGGLATVGSELLLASEYVAGFLAIFIVGPGQPSADMMIRRLVATDGTIMSRFRGLPAPEKVLSAVGLEQTAAPIVLRVFLGLNFLYLGVVQKLLQPGEALGVVSKYGLTNVVPVAPELWVFGAGITEAAVGIALVAGAFTRGAAAVGFLLLTTTLFGLPDDPVLAHITLFGLTSALMVTGAGRYSLDSGVIPSIRDRLDPKRKSAAGATAD